MNSDKALYSDDEAVDVGDVVSNEISSLNTSTNVLTDGDSHLEADNNDINAISCESDIESERSDEELAFENYGEPSQLNHGKSIKK